MEYNQEIKGNKYTFKTDYSVKNIVHKDGMQGTEKIWTQEIVLTIYQCHMATNQHFYTNVFIICSHNQ